MDTPPTDGPFLVAVEKLGKTLLRQGVSGYKDRLQTFHKFHELQDVFPRPYQPDDFGEIVDAVAPIGKHWSRLVAALIHEADAALSEYGESHSLETLYVQRALDPVSQRLASLGFKFDERGRLIRGTPADEFIRECIFGDCKSAPISRGDIQITEVMGTIHGLPRGSIIVDIGAGRGRALSELASFNEFPSWKYYGVNVNDDDRRALQKTIADKNLANAQSLMLDEFKVRGIRADVAMCINVLHSLSVASATDVFSALSATVVDGGQVVVHDFAFPRKDGESGITPWDAEAGASVLERWCRDITGRDFETRSGVGLWTTVGIKSRGFEGDPGAIRAALSERKNRLIIRRRATEDADERKMLNEFCVNIDEKLNS